MRGLIVGLLLAAAAVGTGAAFYLLRDRDTRTGPEEPEPGPRAREPAPSQSKAPEKLSLRPFETPETLVEDLRDALAHGKPALQDEWLRVSGALEPHARRVLSNKARRDANPRVRALLVLAAGVHHPDGPEIWAALSDRAGVVRRAAVLATGYRPGGSVQRDLMPGVSVPVGRRLPDASAARLLDAYREAGSLDDEEAGRLMETVATVMVAGGLSPPR